MEVKSSKPLSIGIHQLPPEVFEHIIQFLSFEDLDACFSVCQNWRFILNSNKIWKTCCIYPEKSFKANMEIRLKHLDPPVIGGELCTWRQCYELQKCVLENWCEGRFEVEKSSIPTSSVSYFVDFVDDCGIHWLFSNSDSGITVWNVTGARPVFHSQIKETGHFSVTNLEYKMVTFRSNYVKVFQFRPPDYEIKLEYRFKFDMDSVLPYNEVVPDDDYMSGVRFILVDHFFVGYSENIININTAFLHVWDVSLAKKIATQSIFQQSHIDYIQSKTGRDATKDFDGGLLLFSGDSKRFLVNVIDDRSRLCHISMFSLDKMRFINVVARLESRTAWCFFKGEVVTIYHEHKDQTSQVSVYNVNGRFLAKLDFPALYNPAFTDEFYFTGNKVILKAKRNMHILTITGSKYVHENKFDIDEEKLILCFFEPKFLLLFDYIERASSSVFVSVWDADSGLKLWELGHLVLFRRYQSLFCGNTYPGKLFLAFKGDEEISVLNFEKGKNKLKKVLQKSEGY